MTSASRDASTKGNVVGVLDETGSSMLIIPKEWAPKPVHHSNLVDDEVKFIALTCERRAEVQALHKHLTTII